MSISLAFYETESPGATLITQVLCNLCAVVLFQKDRGKDTNKPGANTAHQGYPDGAWVNQSCPGLCHLGVPGGESAASVTLCLPTSSQLIQRL